MAPLFRWTIVSVLAGSALTMAAARAAATQQDRLDQMRDALVAGVRDFQKKLDTPKADGTTRTYTYAAHDALALGIDAKVAEDLARRAMARQNMDPSSPSYGDVPWQMFASDIHDANSVEFTFNSVGPIMLGYAQKLSPEFVAEMKPHIAAGILAVHRHKVDVGYTNIYLMKTQNLLLLGQAIGDQGAISDGRQQLENWLHYTATHGIHEYSSPTYASVQLDCLLKAYRFTQQPDAKAELKAALDYLWSDAAASYCPVCEGMGGPHSREYDFLRGTGPIDRFFWLEGLRSQQPLSSLFSDGYMAFLNAVENGYQPSDQILSLATALPRTVKAKWDDDPGKDRYTYITKDFSVGSTSAWYGAQDRQVAVDLGPPSAAPVAMTLSADTFDAPYGKETVKDRSGHNKPHRLRTDIASVQDGGAVLALLNLSPELAKTPAASVATDLLVPLVADEIVIDGKPIRLPDEATSLAQAAARATKPGEIPDQLRDWSVPAHQDSVLGVRCGNAGVAVRIFAADGVGGEEPTYLFKCDGAQWGAGRLVVYQYQGDEKRITQKRIRAGAIVLCDHCASDADLASLMDRARTAKIDQKLDGSTWDVRAAFGDHPTLEAALDLASGVALARRVNGENYQVDRFSVNGRDLASSILDPVIGSR